MSNYFYISGAGTWNIVATSSWKGSTPGILQRIVVNQTAAGKIIAFDSSAVTTGKEIATLKASIPEGSYYFGCNYNTGLILVTIAGHDVTVVYD